MRLGAQESTPVPERRTAPFTTAVQRYVKLDHASIALPPSKRVLKTSPR